MGDLEQAAPTSVAASGPGTTLDTGQAGQAPAGSVASSREGGQPTEPSTAPVPPVTQPDQPKPVWDSKLGWKSQDDAERDYKAVQAAFTKSTQLLRDLGDPAEIKQLRETVDQLRQDPEFVKWAEARVAAQQVGSSDPQVVEALRVVDQRAEAKVREIIAPLMAQAIHQRTQVIFSEMTKAYGEDWQAQKPKMLELHQKDIQRGVVSPQAEQNFDFDYVQGLYHRVLGADPGYAAAQYGKRLDSKRQQATTSQPGTAPSAVTTGPAKSFEEAVAMAKREHGWS